MCKFEMQVFFLCYSAQIQRSALLVDGTSHAGDLKPGSVFI